MNINRILTNCRGVPAVAQNTPARQIHQDHMALAGGAQSSGTPTAPREFFAGDEVDVMAYSDDGDFAFCAARDGSTWWISTLRLTEA